VIVLYHSSSSRWVSVFTELCFRVSARIYRDVCVQVGDVLVMQGCCGVVQVCPSVFVLGPRNSLCCGEVAYSLREQFGELIRGGVAPVYYRADRLFRFV
jgi:hypothetical protein